MEKLWERFFAYAGQELREVRRAPMAVALVLLIGAAGSWWSASRWYGQFYAERFAIKDAQIAALQAQAQATLPSVQSPVQLPVQAAPPVKDEAKQVKPPAQQKPKNDSKSVAHSSTQPIQTLNAANGFAIGGGTVNNPTVNNFAPKPWLLTPEQGDDLVRALRSAPLPAGQRLPMTAVMGDPDSGRLAEQLEQIIKAAGWTIQDGGMSQGMFSTPVPEGIVTIVHSRDSVPKSLVAMANSLVRTGFVAGTVSVQIDAAVPDGTFNLIVGRRPAR